MVYIHAGFVLYRPQDHVNVYTFEAVPKVISTARHGTETGGDARPKGCEISNGVTQTITCDSFLNIAHANSLFIPLQLPTTVS